jgi:hypothetical protein
MEGAAEFPRAFENFSRNEARQVPHIDNFVVDTQRNKTSILGKEKI